MQMVDIFDNPDIISNKEFKTKSCEKLKNLLIDQWKYNITVDTNAYGQKNKLRLYKEFKQSFSFEQYLVDIKGFHCRKIITKFRCSDHTLEIGQT